VKIIRRAHEERSDEEQSDEATINLVASLLVERHASLLHKQCVATRRNTRSIAKHAIRKCRVVAPAGVRTANHHKRVASAASTLNNHFLPSSLSLHHGVFEGSTPPPAGVRTARRFAPRQDSLATYGAGLKWRIRADIKSGSVLSCCVPGVELG